MTQPIDAILNSLGNPNGSPHTPEGGSDVIPLSPLGLDRAEPEPFPANVNATQGAGAAGTYLTPSPGEPADGTIHFGGNRPDSSTGPKQLPVLPGLGALTAGGNFGANGPGVGAAPDGPSAVPAPEAGGPQLTSQGINPALKAALAPRPGPFGDPSL